MSQSDLRKRIRGYEDAYRIYLPRRMPALIRVDGRSFHSVTRGMERPWDKTFKAAMDAAALTLCKEIQGAKVAYIQSDEITIFLTDYDSLSSEPWFGKNLQKMASVSAATASVAFSKSMIEQDKPEKTGTFDSRVFIVPRAEVTNAFIDRQQDCVRNSIESLAQANFSHKSLHGLNQAQLQEKLWQEKGINWNDCEIWQKRGRCVIKESHSGIEGQRESIIRARWVVDNSIPTFTKNRDYIERFINADEEECLQTTKEEAE